MGFDASVAAVRRVTASVVTCVDKSNDAGCQLFDAFDEVGEATTALNGTTATSTFMQ